MKMKVCTTVPGKCTQCSCETHHQNWWGSKLRSWFSLLAVIAGSVSISEHFRQGWWTSCFKTKTKAPHQSGTRVKCSWYTGYTIPSSTGFLVPPSEACDASHCWRQLAGQIDWRSETDLTRFLTMILQLGVKKNSDYSNVSYILKWGRMEFP